MALGPKVIAGFLHDLLALLEPTPDATRSTGVAGWANPAQRIHFILGMFRCYGESQDVFNPPFTKEQVEALKVGRRPEGQL